MVGWVFVVRKTKKKKNRDHNTLMERKRRRQLRSPASTPKGEDHALVLVFIDEDGARAILARQSAVPSDAWEFLLNGKPMSFEEGRIPKAAIDWYDAVVRAKDPDVVTEIDDLKIPEGVVVDRVRMLYTFC